MPGNRAEAFYNSKGIAVLGMSQARKNFAWSIYKSFLKSNLQVYAVHPDGGSKREITFYRSCQAITENVDAAVLCFDLSKSKNTLSELKESGIKKVWFQQGSYNDSLLKTADDLGLEYYTGCALMYLPGTTFLHRLHRFLHEVFSKGKD